MECFDEQIDLQALRDFNPVVLALVYDRYSPLIYRYAARQLGDDDLAEECVAETFSRLLHALRAGNGPRDHVKAYLYRIAHNWITDAYRRRGPIQTELDEDLAAEDSVEGAAEGINQSHHVRRALHQLTDDQRMVVGLRFLEDWDLEETARALGKPVGAVKALQHRALAALRRVLSGLEKERADETIG
jgi:RNA polymerase sigma-70 factor (ECF subfamily)